jgi:hypothetical protein
MILFIIVSFENGVAYSTIKYKISNLMEKSKHVGGLIENTTDL